MYKGDPTFTLGMVVLERGVVAKPKSAILGTPFFIKIFAGFRSLWMIPFYFNALYPLTIPIMISATALSNK